MTTSRKRAVKLKVIGGALRPPRHRVAFGKSPNGHAVEFWTEAEYAALESWERPEDRFVAWFPGHGYVNLSKIESTADCEEIEVEYTAGLHAGRLLRGES